MKLYADRDVIALNRHGNVYVRHVEAMTAEGLHSKSDIAAELAFRDVEIERLRGLLREAIYELDGQSGRELIRRIDAALAGAAVQSERCCLDYPRCDCNSPPEPDDDWLCFQRPAQPKVTP